MGLDGFDHDNTVDPREVTYKTGGGRTAAGEAGETAAGGGGVDVVGMGRGGTSGSAGRVRTAETTGSAGTGTAGEAARDAARGSATAGAKGSRKGGGRVTLGESSSEEHGESESVDLHFG